tara:strand:+ start:91087 stop:91851 length:765 start_codon:yes stop_codon:yes gene_type:complete
LKQEEHKVGELIYDANIYDGMNTFMDDFEFYKRWTTKGVTLKVLELCCGTGRLTIPLAKEGVAITGVDFTETMLTQAKSKSLNAGVQIDFIKADIRDFDLKNTFDLIFIPFNSIHHLYKNEDLFAAFQRVHHHLKADGTFIFDCFNPDIRFITEGEKELKQVSSYATDDGREVVIKEIMQYNHQTQVNSIDWHYYINGQFDSVQKLDMRMFFPNELNHYVTSNGFDILHKFGDFEEGEFNESSQKQIFVCKVKS